MGRAGGCPPLPAWLPTSDTDTDSVVRNRKVSSMIEFTNVSKAFGKSEVLSAVNMTVPTGRITGLVGPNGSGKTTIMRMIGTLLRPTSGEVTVDGLNTRQQSRKVRKRVGLLLGGDAALYDRLTARENAEYFARLQGLASSIAHERIEALAEMLTMSAYLDERVGHFSRGMRQKVSLLRTLIHDPEYVILDEPSTGLDIHGISELQDWIELLAHNGKTILISSHNISEVDRLCGELIIITPESGLVCGSKSALMAAHGSASFHDTVLQYTRDDHKNA